MSAGNVVIDKKLILTLIIFLACTTISFNIFYFNELKLGNIYEYEVAYHEEVVEEPQNFFEVILGFFDLLGYIIMLIGQSVIFVFTCLINVMTLPIPDIPMVIKVLVLIPIWTCVGLLVYEVTHSMVSAIRG